MGERPATAQRTAIRRTAWILFACALASYGVFLASVMTGR